MNVPASRLARIPAAQAARRWSAKRSALDEALATMPTRRYDVSWLDDSGESASLARVAPAIPLFEQAFSAFARGALIPTRDGIFAVEDLVPGMIVETATGPEKLTWIGAITIVPDTAIARANGHRLYRIAADTFGIDRPMPDLVLGPAARVLSRAPAVQSATGSNAALVPISAFADGTSVFEITPASPVRVFHLGFRGHRVVRANGVETESFHPGQMSLGRLGPDMATLFMSLFPQARDMAGFGRLTVPRLGENDIDRIFGV